MAERHFAFFRQGTGEWVREWQGPVPAPPAWLVRCGGAWLLNRWATRVSQPHRGEVGLDVTHIGWPVGEFCYCRFDEIDRRLDWGPPRHYLEIRTDTGEIVAQLESHRPVRAAVPGQVVIDVTALVEQMRQYRAAAPVRHALSEAPCDTVPVQARDRVAVER